MEDVGGVEDVLASTHNSAALEIDGDELDLGHVPSSVDGTGARRKRRRFSNHPSRAGSLGVLLLLAASFASDLAVTAERNRRRRTANVKGGDDNNNAGLLVAPQRGGDLGSLERGRSAAGAGRILQEETEPSGLFDHFNGPPGLDEGAESEGTATAEHANVGGVGGVEEAWLHFVANGQSDGAPQPAPNVDRCKHQLVISLVYDMNPRDTHYELAKVGSTSTLSHTGAKKSNEYDEIYHEHDQIVCMDDGDYSFTISSEFGLFTYELRLATGQIIVSGNGGFPDNEGVTTLFSLPFDEPSAPSATSSNVPTRSPPPGFVGRGQCLDAQGRLYNSIQDDGSGEIRSPHACLDLCESIPVSDPSQLVGFQYDSKPSIWPTCLCLFPTLPDVTDELSAELGILPFVDWETGDGPVARTNDKDYSLSCFSTSPVSSSF